MGYASKLGRARISPSSPQAAGECQRCGFVYSHSTLRWQFDFAGAGLINKQILVCSRCEDTPQEQLRAVLIAADPLPIMNPRVPQWNIAAVTQRTTSGQNTVDPVTGIPIPGTTVRITQDGNTRVTQQTGEAPGGVNQLPGTDPNAPGNSNPGLPPNNTTVPPTGTLTPPAKGR